MNRLTEEQINLLRCYEGGRYKVIRELEAGMEHLGASRDDRQMIAEMEKLIHYLRSCTNRQFFRMKQAGMLDTEAEEAEAVFPENTETAFGSIPQNT